MPDYETKQTAWWARAIAGVLLAVALGFAIVHGLAGRPEALAGLPLLLLALVVANFSTLTVRVNASEVRWWFGRGLVGKSIQLERIKGVQVRHSAWYWGWGIRWTPRGWLWRSSGLEVVWIELEAGKQIGIGTSHPGQLEQAIRTRLESVAPGDSGDPGDPGD